MPAAPASQTVMRWDDVQVVGQFYRNDVVSYRDGLVELSRSAYHVFASQPTRLFLHGFYIRRSLIEFWVFDRSGLYCSEVFGIQRDFDQFLSLVLSYQRMTDRQLGKGDIIETDEGGNYITFGNSDMTSLGKLYLECPPIAYRGGLSGNGTTCYRARKVGSNQWSYAVKFKWRWVRKRPEDELLKLANKNHAWGAVSLDYYKEIETTSDLRQGLRWGTHRRFVECAEKRGNNNQQQHAGHVDGLAQYTEDTDDYMQNRVLTCMVTSPAGRPLHTFQSLSELLWVFHDAIKCHRSLYHDAKILHQDISAGNIIILDDEDGSSPKGILIDLDAAIELADREGAEPSIVGTRLFIAVGVMNGEEHTYRHDLESFLYVFLWTIITNHAESLPETSRLRHWDDGTWTELATRKSIDMTQDRFEEILKEFSPEYTALKPLARSLRQLLFSVRSGILWTGTDDSPRGTAGLYDNIMKAFEEAGVASPGKTSE
ncbi:FunK1 protein kinase [Xylaria arbuscula]|nr:FunK1 protein kinase [Xylaria arbuscula]